MTRKLKVSTFAAAVISAAIASQAHAGFTYDLRVTSGPGIVDSHDVTLPALGGTYTVQLWGQITGDSVLTNDGFTAGYVSLLSSKTGAGAITAGGFVAASGTIGNHVAVVSGSPTIGTGGVDLNGDGVADWGSTNSASTAGWTHWVGGATPGFPDGVTDDQSEKVNANTWEVLLGTYTIAVTTVGSGSTTFTPNVPTSVKTGQFTANVGLAYYQDDALSPGAAHTLVDALNGVTFNAGVTTPEPASLGLLALGGLALMNRRRKA